MQSTALKPPRKKAAVTVETRAAADFQQPRKRTRKLSPQQMQRWLEKEADNSRIYNLTLDVNDLKQQVQQYAMQRRVRASRLLLSRSNFDGAAMRTVDQFFRIYAHGHPVWRPDERNFLVAHTHERVEMSATASGRDSLFEQWERYTRIFNMRSFTNSSMAVIASDPEFTIVKCVGEFNGYVSMATIDVVFPHIRANEALVGRMLGRKIRVPTETLLFFDRSGRIVRYFAHADVFQGLNVLLASSPRDAITMMATAQINTASMIPGTDAASVVDCIGREAAHSPLLPALDADDDAVDAAPACEGGGGRSSIEFILS